MQEDVTMNTNRFGSVKVTGYWATTIVSALELLAGGVTDLVYGKIALVGGEPVVEILAHRGYPVDVLPILGMWKRPRVLTLLLLRFPRLKERIVQEDVDDDAQAVPLN